MSQSVWVVLKGEQHEGGDVVSVHRSKETAVAAALATSPYRPGQWDWSGTEPQDLEWENGWEFIRVQEFTLED